MSSKNWERLTVAQLKEELKELGLSTLGRKAELIERLQSQSNGKKKDKKEKDEEEEEEEVEDEEEEEEVEEKKSKRKSPRKAAAKGKGKQKETAATNNKRKRGAKAAEKGESEASKKKKPNAGSEAVWEPNPEAPVPPITDDDSKYMKIISWNVDGMAAFLKKQTLERYVRLEDPDVICFQETKYQDGNKPKPGLLGAKYPHEWWSCSTAKLGYAGTAVFAKTAPLKVTFGIGVDEHDQEGRTITLEYPSFYLVNTYVPNSGAKLERLEYRQQWNKDLLKYFKKLEATKPVVWCGDLNVAHQEIDIHNPKGNKKTAGFTNEERTDFGALLEEGFVDTWRHLHPEEVQYSYWGYRFNCRSKNKGWRLDYFVVSKSFLPAVKASFIRSEALGSDHCPIGILLDLPSGDASSSSSSSSSSS